MNLIKSFNEVLNAYQVSANKIVLALSGGVDSRVMLHLLQAFSRQNPQQVVSAVHVHHGISPNADEWADKCSQWCREANIPFYLEKVNLGNTQGKSLEQVARTARYDALKHYIGSGDLLLTGQHSDDQLETFVLALKRGSGPKGLSGMAECLPFGEGALLRPLLKVTRRDIEEYANFHQLEWVNDESNADVRYERNFIRHQITPLLESRWPQIRTAVQRSAELCARQEQLIELLLAEELPQLLRDNNSIDIDELKKKPELVRSQLLRFWLEYLNVAMPSKKHLAMIWSEVALAKTDANPVLRLENKQIRRFDGCLYCIDIYSDLSYWSSDISINSALSLPDELGSVVVKKQAGSGSLGARIAEFPLKIIFNPEGLTATPENRHGNKTLKYWFQEYRVPSWLRRRTPILMSGNEVIAVAGLFVCRDYVGDELVLQWDKCD